MRHGRVCHVLSPLETLRVLSLGELSWGWVLSQPPWSLRALSLGRKLPTAQRPSLSYRQPWSFEKYQAFLGLGLVPAPLERKGAEPRQKICLGSEALVVF
jgi:hypothetical protein